MSIVGMLMALAIFALVFCYGRQLMPALPKPRNRDELAFNVLVCALVLVLGYVKQRTHALKTNTQPRARIAACDPNDLDHQLEHLLESEGTPEDD